MNEKHLLHPLTLLELEVLINQRIRQEWHFADLNDIDVSNITDMSYLFDSSSFQGNISKWDVSRVKKMDCMFRKSMFNGDLSGWNVSSVQSMVSMFEKSQFNQNISQ